LMALLCIFAICITGYVAYILGKDAVMQTRLIAKKISVQKNYDKKIASATSLIEKYHQLGPRQALIENALPITPDFPQIVSLIEFAAKSSGITLKSINPDASGEQASDIGLSAATPVPQKVSFNAEIDGSYTNLFQFLQNLEASSRPMRVTAAEIKGNDATMKATLEVETAYQVKSDIKDPLKELE
ncbi:MAG TPA: type 4a pilus biogenesis protein PilO, partial [Candidatus Saccharimonadia bacterium]